MAFNFTPLPSSLRFKKNTPSFSHSSNHSDYVMVGTEPDSAHNQNDLKDDEAIIPSLDIIVRTKPNIEHHEDNNTKSNHKIKLAQSQKQHIHDSKQIMSHLGHSNTEYKSFSTISIRQEISQCLMVKTSITQHSTPSLYTQ
ncbi:hypothetical protein O181_109682 [Austropuccinia psidii MF-1]|uniref:Uncharacterized protein n=1 Tax=Austropuccinia psidii MF-1 TaxID=1389203 RepID=A0A9Q3JWK9_9BASI|nr:hypothetical protein [Austropuccinia psidii MF-1]